MTTNVLSGSISAASLPSSSPGSGSLSAGPWSRLLSDDEFVQQHIEALERAIALEEQIREAIARSDTPWFRWLLRVAPERFVRDGLILPLADFHNELWEWAWNIKPGERPKAYVTIWARAMGKSTHMELIALYWICEGIRTYGGYVCNTQSQADDHVGSVATLLESAAIEEMYPQHAERKVGKYKQSRGWKIDRLRTAGGGVLDSLGLDKANRGAKIDEKRYDFLIPDDVDDDRDTIDKVVKKEHTLSRKIFPAGSDDLAIMAGQNLIHPNSIFSRMHRGESGILANRIQSGPIKAIEDLTWKVVDPSTGRVEITGGRPNWEGLDLAYAQGMIDDSTIEAFLIECQHETEAAETLFLRGTWHSSVHVVQPFVIPRTWYVDRGFDWGKGKPWACLWFAESDGEAPAKINGIDRVFPRGSLFGVGELYGWNGKPNQGDGADSRDMARRIMEYEGQYFKKRPNPGPADSSINDVTDGESIADRMKDATRQRCKWLSADKSPGSRVNGADGIVAYLRAALATRLEEPALYFTTRCPHTARTLPRLPHDPSKDGDVDTNAEDHLWDIIRYRILHPSRRRWARRMKTKGI